MTARSNDDSSNPIDRLLEDHRNFSRLLKLLESNLRNVHDETFADFELMHAAMHYMTHYPEVVHRATEDHLTEITATRTSDVAQMHSKLVSQHDELATDGQEFLEMLNKLVDGALVERQELEEIGQRYVSAQWDHMRFEERELFPLIAHHLTPAERKQALRRAEANLDPLFGPVLLKDYADLLQWVDQNAD